MMKKDELYEKWLRSGGMEDVTFEGLTSALENKGSWPDFCNT